MINEDEVYENEKNADEHHIVHHHQHKHHHHHQHHYRHHHQHHHHQLVPPAGALCTRHILWVALPQRSKLPHSFIISVRPVCARSDNSSEAASRLASSFHSSGQDPCRICAWIIICQRQSGRLNIFATNCSHIVWPLKLYLNRPKNVRIE